VIPGLEKQQTVPKEEKWPKLNGSGFWVAYHGTSPPSAMAMMLMNCGFRSEDTDGTGKKLEKKVARGFEVQGNHRGLFTTRYLEKAMRYALPLWSSELTHKACECCTKIVLIVTRAGVCRHSGGSGGGRRSNRWR